MADAYDCESLNIHKNFSRNQDRFIEGKHYHRLKNKGLQDFLHLTKRQVQLSLSPKARHLTLWTERGAARHAKMLNTEKAWDVFEMLEESFFRMSPVIK